MPIIRATILIITFTFLATLPSQPTRATVPNEPAQFSCANVSEIPQIECEALVAIYNSTGGPSWRSKDGWLITMIPCNWYGVICDQGHVTELGLSNIWLTGAIPAEIGNLSNLTALGLSRNELSNLPPDIANLSNLTALDLSLNQLTSLPAGISNLSNLTMLDLSFNQLTSLSAGISNLSNLTMLDLSFNQLTSLPAGISNLSNLTMLDLSFNQLTSLPAGISNLSNLTVLDLYENQLSSVPTEIGNLSNLTELSLSSNQLSSVPTEIGNLSNLTELSLSSNQLSSVPTEIGNLSNLTSLYLYSNQLNSVPPEIGSLSNLTIFLLYSNQLSSVPPEIGNLSNLTNLNLDYNRITVSDPELLTFLNDKQSEWVTTQTIAPTGLSITARSENSIQLSWTPIAFQEKGGYYEISIATDEVFTIHGRTADKSSNRYTIGGLDEGTDYNIRIRTYTPAHTGWYSDPVATWDDQRNELWSEYSKIISATTLEAVDDDYETDNQCPDATAIDISGFPRVHNFHAAVDEDWVTFDATEGEIYRIEVDIPAGSRADVDMSVYAECGTLPDTDSSWYESFAPGVRTEFEAPTTGPVYLRLTNHDTTVGGRDFAYRLKVRQLSDTPQTGIAIIVAGRLKGTDRLQDNIHYATGVFYEALVANGYAKDDIYYLATDSELLGYNAPATLENLELAITQWAKERVSADRALTLYMMNHGDRDLFFVDDVRGDRLTPSQLDGWLDTLQDDVPGLKMNIIIEACNSGSFIEGDDTISGPDRVVIASTNESNLAYASKNGAHFTDHFVGRVRQGYDLFSSFGYAKDQVEAINFFQEPWLDADGDGEVNELNDYLLAVERGFDNPGSFSDAWPPYIASAQAIATDSRNATDEFTRIIEAEVRDNRRVRDVQAIIYPPSYQPPTDGQELVQEPEEVIVLQSQGNDKYAVTYRGFTERGTYRIHVHAVDEDGLEAAPIVLEINTGSMIYLPTVVR